MSLRRKKIDLIPELTTHKNDYKPWPMPKNEISSIIKAEETLCRRKHEKIPQIDYQSHQNYMRNVPFDLYIDAKPIVGVDPRDPIPQVKEPNSICKTDNFRYKLAGKLTSNITEQEVVRQLLIATYHPIHKQLYQDACLKVPRPPELPNTVLINDKTGFTPQLYPPLPPGWVNAAKHWDCLQSRSVGDPTKSFWLRRGPEVECFSKSNYREVLPEETKREIKILIEEDKLRLPFTVTKTGYSGYRQISAKGVPLARNKDFNF